MTKLYPLIARLGKEAATQAHSRTVKVNVPGAQARIATHMEGRGNQMPPHRLGRKVAKPVRTP